MGPQEQPGYHTRLARNFFAFCLILFLGSASLQAVEAELTLKGVRFVSLKTVAGTFGMKRSWVVSNQKIEIRSEWTRMEFTVNKRDFSLNGTRVYLGSPVVKHRSDLYIEMIDLERTLQPILTPQIYSRVPKLYRIVIDPGHGGKDPGTQNKSLGLDEKNLVLDISRRLQKILSARGYSVSLTRNDDRFIDLRKRPALANQAGADLFISVHLNAFTSSSVSGSETYAFTPQNQPSTRNSRLTADARKHYPANNYDAWNTLLGYYVQNELVGDLKTVDRGLKRARWPVLETLDCPGLLIEAGFVTNSVEGRKLRTAAYRQQVAQAIADGITRYQKTINRLRGKG